MATMSQRAFLEGVPVQLPSHLPPPLRQFQVRRPWGGIIQIHYGEPSLHYEVGRVRPRPGQTDSAWELGFHCEARDKRLNRFLLDGFRRHLFEIKTELGPGMEAEMWDRGWTKIYEVMVDVPTTSDAQAAMGQRLAAIITTLHPIFIDLRAVVRQVYR